VEIGAARERIVGLALMLAANACLIGPNPDFIEADADSTTTADAECPVDLLDCDATPGCESHIDDELTCGSCDNACILGGELTACVLGQCIGSATLLIDADADVDASLPDQNFGESPVLRIDATHHAYLRLPDLAELPDDATIDWIDSITLHLDCVAEGASIEFYRVEQAWDELELTDSNAPPMAGSAVVSVTPVIGENSIELVDLLGAWQNGSASRSLGIRRGSAEGTVEFVSSEGGATPYLVVTGGW
jgi:hypothetical protein